jgi:hypothetical protein
LYRGKWELFAQLVATGACGSIKEAYGQAGFSKARAAKVSASHLYNHPLVSARIGYLKEQAARKVSQRMVETIEASVGRREWVLDKLVHNVQVCMGEKPLRKRRLNPATKKVEVMDVFVHKPASALRALHLLGMEEGMFKTEFQPPPPADLAAPKNVEDPRILERLERYRKKQAKGIQVIEGGKGHEPDARSTKQG